MKFEDLAKAIAQGKPVAPAQLVRSLRLGDDDDRYWAISYLLREQKREPEVSPELVAHLLDISTHHDLIVAATIYLAAAYRRWDGRPLNTKSGAIFAQLAQAISERTPLPETFPAAFAAADAVDRTKVGRYVRFLGVGEAATTVFDQLCVLLVAEPEEPVRQALRESILLVAARAPWFKRAK